MNDVIVRDNKGRFAKGHSGNPLGRKPRVLESEIYDLAISTISNEVVEKIMAKAIKQAISGDRYAREWLGKLLFPTPQQVMLNKIEVNNIEQDTTTQNDLMQSLIERMGVMNDDNTE